MKSRLGRENYNLFYSAHQPLSAPFLGLPNTTQQKLSQKGHSHILHLHASNVRIKDTHIYYNCLLVMCTLRTLAISYTTSAF